jgi:type I restriction enzyme S subunit
MMANLNLSELPKGWTWSRLVDCVEILDSKRIPINADERGKRIAGKKPSELIPYYGATGRVGWIDDYLFDEELVLLGEDGAPFLDSFKNKAYIINGKSWVNNHAHVLKAISEIITNRYLCHFLNTFDYHSYVSGTTRLKLNQGPMRNMPIPLPPITEQQRIVAKIEELFSDLEAGVEALKKTKAQLKLYRHAILKAAFEGRLTATWREAHKDNIEPANLLLEQIREERRRSIKGKRKEPFPFAISELPELPNEWLWVPFFEVGEAEKNAIVDGPFGSNLKVSDYVENGEIPVISITNIDVGYNKRNIRFITKTKYETIKRSAVNPGDIVMAKIGSSYGKSGIYPEWMPTGIIPANLIKITISRLLIKKYAYYYLKSLFFKDKLDGITKSTAQPAFNVTAFKMIPFPFPPYNEQERIVDEIEYRFSLADGMEQTVDQSLKQSERLRQSILKQAFVGGLVPQDLEDEPAAELLERIKTEKAGHPAGRRSHAGIKRTGKLW